jgi:hypothetical protein
MPFIEAFGTVLAVTPIKVLLGCAVLFILCWERFVLDMANREPPLLRPNIPIIGHLIGILWHQSVYLEKLGYVHIL